MHQNWAEQGACICDVTTTVFFLTWPFNFWSLLTEIWKKKNAPECNFKLKFLYTCSLLLKNKSVKNTKKRYFHLSGSFEKGVNRSKLNWLNVKGKSNFYRSADDTSKDTSCLASYCWGSSLCCFCFFQSWVCLLPVFQVVHLLKSGKGKEVSYNALATHIIAEDGDNPEVGESREVFDLPVVKVREDLSNPLQLLCVCWCWDHAHLSSKAGLFQHISTFCFYPVTSHLSEAKCGIKGADLWLGNIFLQYLAAGVHQKSVRHVSIDTFITTHWHVFLCSAAVLGDPVGAMWRLITVSFHHNPHTGPSWFHISSKLGVCNLKHRRQVTSLLWLTGWGKRKCFYFFKGSHFSDYKRH